MFIDNQVTRFGSGVTNNEVASIFNSMTMLDPTKFHVFLEDFDYFTAGDWTITEVGAAGTEALADGDGGLLLLTVDAGAADSIAMQKVGSSFLMAAGKKAFGKFRLKLNLATQSRFLIGLAITDTTPEDATDGMYFIKADGSTDISVVCRKNATTGSTTAVATTLVDDTFIDLCYFYDGVDRLYYGYNTTVVGYLDASASFLPDIVLTPTIFVGNGEAVAKIGTVDLFFAAKER